jgi:hypothetical protein
VDVEALDAIEVSASPLSQDETQRIIARIEDVVRDRHVVLVGGQAVSVWIGQLEDRLEDKLTTAPTSRGVQDRPASADARADSILARRLVLKSTNRYRTAPGTPLSPILVITSVSSNAARSCSVNSGLSRQAASA